MSLRTIASLTIFCLSTWLGASAQSAKERNMNTAQPQTKPHTRTLAKAKITVKSSAAQLYDQSTSPSLMEIHLNETFTGDIDGTRGFGLYRSWGTINLPA